MGPGGVSGFILSFIRAAAFLAAMIGMTSGVLADPIKTPAGFNLVQIIQIGPTVYIEGTGGWYQVVQCEQEFCLEKTTAPSRPTAPAGPDAMPERQRAQVDRGQVRAAWYSHPTTRYRHGILGDAIEAGQLNVQLENGRQLTLTLPQNAVFEDLVPRLFDIDADGAAEIVTLRSTPQRGGAVAIYKAGPDGIKHIQSLAEIGQGNRWLNIAGFHDWTGDGRADLAVVQTPHIGGTLRLYAFADGQFRQIRHAAGFSNHAIGSRALDLSLNLDMDGDGIDDLLVPSADRRELRVLFPAKPGKKGRRIPLSTQVYHNLGLVSLSAHRHMIYADRDGNLYAQQLR